MRQGLEWTESTGECFYKAELHQLQGELLHGLGRVEEARRCFFRARALARQLYRAGGASYNVNVMVVRVAPCFVARRRST